MKYIFIFLLFTANLFSEQVALVAFGPGPAEHFKAYAKTLEEAKISTLLIGGDISLRMWGRGINCQSDGLDKIVSECAKCKVVITDAHDPRFADLHKKLKEKAPFTKRLLYYDNPESYVPGGYSENIASICASPIDGVIFANTTFLEKPIFKEGSVAIDLGSKKRFGVGFYPLDDVEKMRMMRSQRKKNQKLTLLYVGGANREYYEKVIPHFAELLCTTPLLENVTVQFASHPRAKMEGNLDLIYLKKFAPILESRKIEIVPTEISLLECASKADFVLYSQTSAAPKFILAGIPTIQIAPKPFEDALVREKMVPTVATTDELIAAMGTAFAVDKNRVLSTLGIAEDWKERLISIIKTME